MRKKALIISPNGLSDVGGVERVMAYVARVLHERGDEVVVLDRKLLADSRIGRMLARPLKSRLGYVWESMAMSRLASKLRGDDTIVIGNGYSACFARTDILFAHGSSRGNRLAKHSAHPSPRIAERLRLGIFGPDERMEAMAGRRAKELVAVSKRTADEWASFYGVDRARIRVLPNAVDASHFCPARTRARRLDAGASADVLFVGRLEWRKGIDRLARLAEYLSKSAGSSVRAGRCGIVVAAPSAGEDALNLVNSGVEITVGVKFADLPGLYRSCGAMYLPSRYEGFEMVTLEALACGTPVVGSDVGAISYLAGLHFPGVYVVDPEDLKGTAETLRRASEEWADFRKKQELHDRVAAEFGLEAWASKFGSLLGEMDG